MAEILEVGTVRLDATALAAVCQRFEVRELAVFGSAARREDHAGSDLDLMVEFQPGARVGLVKFESLAEALRDQRVLYAD